MEFSAQMNSFVIEKSNLKRNFLIVRKAMKKT